MRDYVDVDVSTWSLMRVEPMGSKPDKLWLRDPDSHDDGPVSWLFKPRGIQREEDRQFPRGEDWAEKIVAALAVELAIPAAGVELAHRDDQLGIISRNVVEGRALVLGNEVLAGADPDYDPDRQRAVPGYTVEAVVAALEALGATAPITSPRIDAASIFAGYLVLDALVANMDRHHENWGVLIDQRGIAPPVLSPTFDHACHLSGSSSPTRSGPNASTPRTGTERSTGTLSAVRVATSPDHRVSSTWLRTPSAGSAPEAAETATCDGWRPSMTRPCGRSWMLSPMVGCHYLHVGSAQD